VSAGGGEILATEYLYAIEAGHFDGDDSRFYVPQRVVSFPITKKTPKRIYYVASADWELRPRIGFVDRQRIEADGEVYSRNRHWSAPDFHLYLNPPALDEPGPALAELKAAMRAAHPDMGGTHEDFLRAHEQYEKARAAEASDVTRVGQQRHPRKGTG
jgi:hypothetical protein